MANSEIKPTFSKPISDQSKVYQKGFDRALANQHVKLNEFDANPQLNEIDSLLGEAEQSLKKKIFSLAKMEALVFSDPKLSAIYDEMSENGEEKYGYHYNETIQNMIFNDYVLNSPKYLQKYKQAVPKEKKRRDKSGINQLKKSGEDMQTRNLDPKPLKPVTEGNDDDVTEVLFLVNERDPGNPDLFAYFPEENYDRMGNSQMGYSHIGQHSAVRTEYAEESREAKPREYQALKAELEGLGYNLHVLNSMQETTSAGGGASGAFTAPLGYKKVDETTTSASSGAYVGPSVWGSGDLMKTKGKANVKKVPMVKGGTIIQESANYLTEAESFEKFFNELNEVETPMDAPIIDKTAAFTSNTVHNWNVPDTKLEYDTLKTGKPDSPNLNTMEESQKIEEKAVSKSQQKFMGMVHAVQKGELSPDKVGGDVADAAKSMKPKDAEDFASTKHKGLPEKVKPKKDIKEEAETMIGDSPDTMANKPAPIGTQSSNMDLGARSSGGGMNESLNLLEEINNELKAFSIHQDKLKRMTEDRKPSSMVMKDRLGAENQTNFKKDLQHSSTKEIINVEKELQWKDQQTEVGKDPMKLGADIEKKAVKTSGDAALENVGNSTNDKGNEIPKRNLTDEEQEEVNNYRLGLGDVVFDNKPDKRFEDRMKADMGDKLYDQRQKNLEFRGKAPMYNKDPQPTKATDTNKVQFNKEKTGWSERQGLKECNMSGKYSDVLGKQRIIDFNLSEVKEINESEGLFVINLAGLGNSYTQKVSVNESVVRAMNENTFFTNGTEVFAMKNKAQKLNESKQSEKPVVNEQMNKMKHLLGYTPDKYIDTKNTKINRGF